MGISLSSEYSDVLEDSYLQGVVTVSTTETQAKVGASNLEGRELLRIVNKSSVTIYIGPTGVTTTNGEPLLKNQVIEMPVGSGIDVYMIVSSGTADIIVQEFA